MDIATFKTSLDFLSEDKLEVVLYFIFKTDDEQISIKQAKLDVSIISDLAKKIVVPAIFKVVNNTELIEEYDSDIVPVVPTVYSLSAVEVEQYSRGILDAKRIEEISDIYRYEDSLGYIVKLSKNGDTAYVIRKISPSHILKKGFTLHESSEGELTRFTKSILTIDKKIDAILYKEDFIVVQKNNFERCLRHLTDKSAQALHNARELVVTYGLLDLQEEELESFIDAGIRNKLKKLDMKLLEDGIYNFENISKLCDELSINITKNQQNTSFSPKDKKEFNTIIRILSDDYLTSTLTQRKYSSNSKVEIIKNPE